MDSDLPRFYTVNGRPVKMIGTPSGGMDVLAYDWDTGRFVRDLSYSSQVLDPWKDVDDLSEEEFETLLKELKQK